MINHPNKFSSSPLNSTLNPVWWRSAETKPLLSPPRTRKQGRQRVKRAPCWGWYREDREGEVPFVMSQGVGTAWL